ncbi:MAG: 50S ribosomal protein L6 [Opitutales bacterium]|nr:50S ribosomal protein L6 [Opitutales bacterium]
MSRIGKSPIPIPENVEVSVSDVQVSVSGPKGNLSKCFESSVSIEVSDSQVVVSPKSDSRHARAMHGTVRSIVANMVLGVVEGFSKKLEINGVGFKAIMKGDVLDMDLGYSHPIEYPIPEGIQVTIADNVKLTVEGADKQLVGEVAAKIKRFYPVEPYKGKGIRIIGEYVRRKEGKKTA